MSEAANGNHAQLLDKKYPESLHVLFEHYLNNGDMTNSSTLYEANAILIERDGKTYIGKKAIQGQFSVLLSMKPTIHFQHQKTIRAGDIALLVSDWKITGVGPDNTHIEDNGRTCDVIRLQVDGTWRFVIQNPWGVV